MKTGHRKLHWLGRGDSAPDPVLFDVKQKWDFCEEGMFRQNLTKERKRAERSLRPFLLVLIGLGGKEGKCSASPCSTLIDTICSQTRATDIKGWYQRGKVIGVICTEITPQGSKKIEEKIKGKIQSSANSCTVEIGFYQFPSGGGGGGAPGDKLGHFPHCFYPPQNSFGKRSYLFLKRVYDFVGSAVALLFFAPLFAIIALLIKLDSGGSVFFVQKRIGAGGQSFDFYKFRTMYQGMDDAIHREYVKKLISGGVEKTATEKAAVYKIENDPRVTPVGRWLRKSSLDELPQLFNVLKGEMSLVGPRPAIPYEFDQYQPWHRSRVMEQKPGITGLWQVEGRSQTTFDGMVRMDLKYCKSYSLIEDIRLLLRTPKALLSAKGAY